MFYSTSTEAQPNNDTSEPLDIPKPTSTEAEKSVDAADGVDSADGAERKEWMNHGKPKKVKKISNSSEALRELQASLAQAAKKDGVILEDERSIPWKLARAATLRKPRSKKGKEVVESTKDEPTSFSTQPIAQISKEHRAAAELLSQITRARERQRSVNSIDSTNTQETKSSLSRGRKRRKKAAEEKRKSQETKKDAETSKTKENASEPSNIPKASKESEPEKGSTLVRRGARKPTSLHVRRITTDEPKSRDEFAQLASTIPFADAARSPDKILKGTTGNSYALAVPEFLKRYPRIARKAFD